MNDFGVTVAFSDFLNGSAYSDLPKDDPRITLCQNIANYKQQNPYSSTNSVVAYYNEQNSFNTASAISYNTWTTLTTKEKLLIVSNPVAAAITASTQTKAFAFTSDKFGSNGLGDKSDAWRHTMWNVLMCKYTDKIWAWAYATAHEDKSQEQLNQK